MSSSIHSVDQKTNPAGQNRFELLLFRLQGMQLFGINVFKVREVLPCPQLNRIPGTHSHVVGVADVRGEPVSVIDLSAATGGQAIHDLASAYILVAEYNRHVQAFLVAGVERIVNVNWSDMKPPPHGVGRTHYLTSVTRIDDRMVQVIDVEKVFHEISPANEDLSPEIIATIKPSTELTVLVVDDSLIARSQIQRALGAIGLKVEMANDGQQALKLLRAKADNDADFIKTMPLGPVAVLHGQP